MTYLADKAGNYAAEIQVAYSRAGILGWLLPIGWLFFPFALQSALHPTDAFGLMLYIHGEAVPRSFTPRMRTVGEFDALGAIAVLILLQLVGSVLFYRRVKMETPSNHIAVPPLWPIAGVLLGFLGNGVWWVCTGYFDGTGFLVGLSSLVLTVGCEVLCEVLGRNFVFGPGEQPLLNPWLPGI